MAEDNRNFALQVVQSQQNLVGSSVAGGSAAIGGADQSVMDTLTQIKELTLKSFRKTSEIAKTLLDSFTLEKNKERRERDEAAERNKELGKLGIESGKGGKGGNLKGENEELNKQTGLLTAILGSQFIKPIIDVFKKIFKFLTPLFAFFNRLAGPMGRLLPFLRGFGVVGLVITGVSLLFRYFDDIKKALDPALQKLSEAYTAMKPFLDGLVKVFDYVIKGLIAGVGNILTTIIGDVMTLFGGFKKMFTGDFMGGVEDIFFSIVKFIFRLPYVIFLGLQPLLSDAWNYISEGWDNLSQSIRDWFTSLPERFMNALRGIGDNIVYFFGTELPNTLKRWINGLIDSIPIIPQGIKNKFKFDVPAEPEMNEGSISKTQTENVLPKTINQDKTVGATTSMTSAVTTIRETGGETIEKTGYTRDQKEGDINTYTKTLNNIDDKIKSLENQFGFPEFEVGNPDYDNAIAEEAKDNPALAKAWRSYKGLIRKKYNTIETLKAIEVRPIEEPTITTTKFDRTIAKRDLAGEGGASGNVTVINNQPTTVTSTNDIKKADMYSGRINTSSGDSYFDKTANGYT